MPTFETVAHLDSQATAEIAAGALHAAGIDVLLETRSPYTESPTAGGEGMVDLRVPEEQVAAARQVLGRDAVGGEQGA